MKSYRYMMHPFAGDSFYTKDMFEGKEDDGQIFEIKRLPIHKFRNGELRLVPVGLLECVQKGANLNHQRSRVLSNGAYALDT